MYNDYFITAKFCEILIDCVVQGQNVFENVLQM